MVGSDPRGWKTQYFHQSFRVHLLLKDCQFRPIKATNRRFQQFGAHEVQTNTTNPNSSLRYFQRFHEKQGKLNCVRPLLGGTSLWLPESVMNFGAKSRDLLVELKRSDWLPPYNEDSVRGVLAEIQALYDELTDTLGGRTTVRTLVRYPSAVFGHLKKQLRGKWDVILSYFQWLSEVGRGKNSQTNRLL